MNKEFVARELIKVAKDLVGAKKHPLTKEDKQKLKRFKKDFAATGHSVNEAIKIYEKHGRNLNNATLLVHNLTLDEHLKRTKKAAQIRKGSGKSKVSKSLLGFDFVDIQNSISSLEKDNREHREVIRDIEKSWQKWDYDALEDYDLMNSKMRRELDSLDEQDPTGDSSEELSMVVVNAIKNRIHSLGMIIRYNKEHISNLRKFNRI